MSVEIEKSKIRLKNKIAYSVRASQAVLQYGVGAMVDFRDCTLMTAAPEYWGNSVIHIHDERLEKILHVDYFGKPGDKDDAKFGDGISYVRFPEWYFCPSCRRFKPIIEWVSEYRTKNSKRAEEDPHIGIVNKSAVEKSPKIANGKNASELTEWSEAERRKFRCGAKRKAAS